MKDRYPDDNILLYFTDTLWEHPDLYRFINEGSDKLQLPMLTHSYGLTPMQLMFEKKLVFNSMIGDCSKILKMKVARDFLKKGQKPAIEKWRNAVYLKDSEFIADATIYFGIGFDEMHRQGAIEKNWQPFKVEFPLIDNNIWVDRVLEKHDIKQPELYDFGFSHNNCHGRCVKAGQGHYRLLKEKMPDTFREIMEQEHHLKICVSAYRYITDDKVPEADRIPPHVQEEMLAELDDAYRDYFYGRAAKPKLYIHPAGAAVHRYMEIQQYAFMKKGTGKYEETVRYSDEGEEIRITREIIAPYPIRDLHYEVENDMQIDLFDIGGCGCFTEGTM